MHWSEIRLSRHWICREREPQKLSLEFPITNSPGKTVPKFELGVSLVTCIVEIDALFSLKVMKCLSCVTNSQCPNFMDTKQLSNYNSNYDYASPAFSATGPDI